MQQLFVIVVFASVLHFIWGGGVLPFTLNLNDVLHTKNDSFAYPKQMEYPNNKKITISFNSHSILYLSGVMQEILKYVLCIPKSIIHLFTVQSGLFGLSVYSDILFQTVVIQMRWLILSHLIWINTVCLIVNANSQK